MTSNTPVASPTFESIGIKNSTINEGPNVSLNPAQKVIVGSVLDLMEGRPSLKHLSLWRKTAIFEDPIAVAEGFDRYAAQWYGLPTMFNPIAIQQHTVTSAGNPIEVSLKNKYVVKGINKEQIMDSVVRIHVGSDGMIERVADRWNDKLPEGSISETFRGLSAMTTASLVKVPKTEEEDRQMQAGRQNQGQ